MSSEPETPASTPAETPGDSSSAAAVGLALGRRSKSTAVDTEAAAFLARQTTLSDKQIHMLDLQMENLHEQRELHIGHMRAIHSKDLFDLAIRTGTALIAAIVISILGSMIVGATHDHDLVVDILSVPPDLAAKGLNGQVVANKLLDNFAELQGNAASVLQAAGVYRRGNEEAIKIDIPDTGISLAELDRYLRAKLGHETHVSGEVVRTPAGLAVTVRYGDNPGRTFEGQDTDFNTLMRSSAEGLFAQARPLRYADYLIGAKRYPEAVDLLQRLASHGSRSERALAYSSWSNLLVATGDMAGAEDKSRTAVSLNPTNSMTHAWRASVELQLGHDQAAFDAYTAGVRDWAGSIHPEEGDLYTQNGRLYLETWRDDQQGDYRDAVHAWALLTARGGFEYLDDLQANGVRASDLAREHDLAAARGAAMALPRRADGLPATGYGALVDVLIQVQAEDWPATLKIAKWADDAAHSTGAPDQVFIAPLLSEAMARTGDIAGAQARIATTPLDCDPCVRSRGMIAAMAGDWPAANRWFEMVASRSPAIPFAETDWGEALLAKGDLDGAIAKLAVAHRKGPFFADPLELWGEALARKGANASASAKFAEADKLAPRWSRNHLMWGRALATLGDASGARAQISQARALGLNTDQDALAARELKLLR